MPSGTKIYLISGPKRGVGAAQPNAFNLQALSALPTQSISNAEVAQAMKGSAAIGSADFPNITWQSQPVFDTWGPNWIDGYWGCAEWQEWYTALKLHYGVAEARTIWLTAFESQSTGAGPFMCKYNTSFQVFAISNGLIPENDVFWLGANLADALGAIANGAGEVIEDTSDAASNLSGILKWALPVAAIVAGVWAVDKYVYPILPRR